MTTKELTALEEQLGSEEVTVKKYRTMARQCSDPAIRGKLEDLASRHQRHFDTLLCYLK